MRFDCSLISICIIKIFVFLKKQEFQSLLPHLYLDQIVAQSLCSLAHLILQHHLIDSFDFQKIILVYTHLHFLQLYQLDFNSLINNALEFELSWLNCKKNLYGDRSQEENQRIKTIESRLKNPIL